MSRPAIPPLSVGATAPEFLSLLQQRLLVAERQAKELVHQLDSLGVSKEQLQARPSERTVPPRPPSPVKVYRALRSGGDGILWRQCESLVGRLCRLESLLHTLKLNTFRLETERELNPSHTARLQERLAALQEESEEEQRSLQKEVMRLKNQLQQTCEEREEAWQEAHRLRQELDISHSSKMDVAMAADELKVVKIQMSQKLQQMNEEMEQETAARLEAEQSHNALLRRVEEIEEVVEREREQVKVLQTDCHTLRVDGQEARAELDEKDDLIQYLQKDCEQLRDQLGLKEVMISELNSELKSVRTALQKQQEENRILIIDGGELRAAADTVQRLNNQLDTQCSDLSSALHSITVENNHLQMSLKMEQERVSQRVKEQDLLLDAAKRNIQSELQGVLADRLLIKKELEVLRSDHAKLQQNSAIALETAVSHQDLLERTIARLREEASGAAGHAENMQKERDEMTAIVSKLEKEQNSLETQLSELQEELFETNSALLNREEENRGLMGKLAAVQHQQNQQKVEQMLYQLLDSKNKLAYENSKLQAQVQQLGVECKEQRQTSSSLEIKCTQMSTELKCVKVSYESLQKDYKQAQGDLQMKDCEVCMLHSETAEVQRENQRLRQQLTMIQQNTEVGEKEQDQRTLQREREAELDEAREELGRLAKQVDTLTQQLQREKDCGRKLAQWEVSELKKALDNASARSADLSRANRELREKLSELEKIVSNQKSRIKAQKAQLKQHVDNRMALAHSQKIKDLEADITSLENSKNEYEKKSLEQSQSLQQVCSEVTSLQTELQRLSSSQQEELQAARDLALRLQEKCEMLEQCVARLIEDRDEAEVKMREVSLESQQISDNLQEAHCWFRTKFKILNADVGQNVEPQECAEQTRGTSKDRAPGSLAQDTGTVQCSRATCVGPVLRPGKTES